MTAMRKGYKGCDTLPLVDRQVCRIDYNVTAGVHVNSKDGVTVVCPETPV
jgi:hypothetical protein